MMIARDASSENDVLYRFAMSYQHPDADQLDEYVRRNPAHADALTALAIELAIEHANGPQEGSDAETYQVDSDTDATLLRAMSHFQNRLFEAQTAQKGGIAEHPSVNSGRTPRDLFAHRSPTQMQTLREKLDISPLFLKRLRDREIRATTIPPAFIRLIATAVEVVETEVTLYFAGRPQIAANVNFKSDVTPTVGDQVTFEQAVRNSGMTPEQQARLLAL